MTIASLVQRRRIEDLIERLIGFLDDLDGDPDLEPSLGMKGNDLDLEDDNDFEPDLAGSSTDFEYDEAELDDPGFIWGGQGA